MFSLTSWTKKDKQKTSWAVGPCWSKLSKQLHKLLQRKKVLCFFWSVTYYCFICKAFGYVAKHGSEILALIVVVSFPDKVKIIISILMPQPNLHVSSLDKCKLLQSIMPKRKYKQTWLWQMNDLRVNERKCWLIDLIEIWSIHNLLLTVKFVEKLLHCYSMQMKFFTVIPPDQNK